jgi:hypothetical protein
VALYDTAVAAGFTPNLKVATTLARALTPNEKGTGPLDVGRLKTTIALLDKKKVGRPQIRRQVASLRFLSPPCAQGNSYPG